MASLTDRAERALLGALLADPAQAARVRYLRPDDFADPRHQVVFTGLTRADSQPGMAPGQWHNAVAFAGGRQVTASYLRDLVTACPHPAHADAYAAMVIQARLARRLASRAGELASESADLGRDARHVIAIGGAGGQATARLADHLGHLAIAFREHADRLTIPGHPGLTPIPELAPPPAIGQDHEVIQQQREERVLAALLRGHPETRQVLSFLPVSAFAAAVRQELFQAIRALDAAGKPVDALTADWELSQRGAQPPGAAETYTTRLAAADPGTGSPLKDASILLARLQHRSAMPPATAAMPEQGGPHAVTAHGYQPAPPPWPGTAQRQPGTEQRM